MNIPTQIIGQQGLRLPSSSAHEQLTNCRNACTTQYTVRVKLQACKGALDHGIIDVTLTELAYQRLKGPPWVPHRRVHQACVMQDAMQ